MSKSCKPCTWWNDGFGCKRPRELSETVAHTCKFYAERDENEGGVMKEPKLRRIVESHGAEIKKLQRKVKGLCKDKGKPAEACGAEHDLRSVICALHKGHDGDHISSQGPYEWPNPQPSGCDKAWQDFERRSGPHPKGTELGFRVGWRERNEQPCPKYDEICGEPGSANINGQITRIVCTKPKNHLGEHQWSWVPSPAEPMADYPCPKCQAAKKAVDKLVEWASGSSISQLHEIFRNV